MPWRVTSPMYQRQRFVLDAQYAQCAFAELCRRYGISRKTGYKWLARYATAGPDSLVDMLGGGMLVLRNSNRLYIA